MAKKKPASQRGMEKDMERLHDHIRQQNFENIEELQAFLDQLSGKKIDEFLPKKKGRPSKKEQAAALLDEAYESTVAKGRKLAKTAIELDPDNADAYCYLAETERDIKKVVAYYRQGMEAGKRLIGEKEFEELKGHFLGFHETRPYMRAKAGYAECLTHAGNHKESMQQYAEMIELNPGDNQGVRYHYAAMLVHYDQFEDYKKLYKLYKDEGSALWLFTYAAYLFRSEGKTNKSERALLKAHESNRHLISFFLGEKKMPDALPDYYSWGDESEAVIYLQQAGQLWLEDPGMMRWAIDIYRQNK